MEIKSLNIKNYKSIVDLTLTNPNPFSVFVGPNAAGKSNIFDALEFYTIQSNNFGNDVARLFGDIYHYGNETEGDFASHFFEMQFEKVRSRIELTRKGPIDFSASSDAFFDKRITGGGSMSSNNMGYGDNASYIQFFKNFSRIFVGNEKIQKFAFDDGKKLSLSCQNLERVLHRVLIDDTYAEEIAEWLKLLIPGFDNLTIATEELSGSQNLLIYEKGIKKPLTKKIISDGTYNIIAILTALYQSDEPQFLCIEEPENGLNPKVVRELVKLFRQACKEKGHFIWLNTHSQSIVSELTTEEIILVDKVDGETKVKQIQGMDLHGLPMDEALLTNTIGGGIPW